MTPRPGTGRNGRQYPYYVCTRAEKTKGRDCKLVYLPAKSVDDVLLEYLRGLQFRPEVVSRVTAEAHAATDKQLHSVTHDVERVELRLAQVRRQMSNLVDVLAEQGTGAPSAVRRRMELLSADELKLEAELEVLKERAAVYRHNMTTATEAMDCRSIRDFARRTGRDHSFVARHLRVLKLPDEVLTYLEENQTPETLQHFPIKRLDALTRLPEAEAVYKFRQEARHSRGAKAIDAN